jgi:HSP20 family protein
MFDDLIEITRIHSQLSALYNQLRELERRRRIREPGVWRPNIDILEGDDHITVLVELPGVRVEDIAAEISDNILEVKGCKRAPTVEEPEGTFLCLERCFGQFSCRIALDQDVDPDAAEARLEDGELKISFPKQGARGKKVIRLKIDG